MRIVDEETFEKMIKILDNTIQKLEEANRLIRQIETTAYNMQGESAERSFSITNKEAFNKIETLAKEASSLIDVRN